MLTGIVLATDIWAGQNDINEYAVQPFAPLQIIRINSIQGGHHLDSMYASYLAQAMEAGFLWTIYFVYNPWVDGVTNAKWLLANLPKNCPKRIMFDVEVKYAGYSPKTYGSELQKCCDIIEAAGYIPTIYTGEWFLSLLTPWPKNVDYWWAQYPTVLYPATVTKLSWENLLTIIQTVNWPPSNAHSCPGTIKLWQCSGDRLIPTGFTTVVDINIWKGTIQDLVDWIKPCTNVEVSKPIEPVVIPIPIFRNPDTERII
jgi:GH25 family lysozyme M1 (1,4-beta-N-acetylmuramidase)